MSNESEKLTINLGVVELAQIDVLVEQGIFSNRSDLIRSAVRKELELHKDRMDISPITVSSKVSWTKTIGIMSISKKMLEKLARDNEKISLSIIGMLMVGSDVTTSLFEQTVENILVRGKIVASEEIKALIREMN